MTPYVLQEALVEEVKLALKDFTLKNEKGEETKVNVYQQFLPKDEEENEQFPYVSLKFTNQEDTSEESLCRIEFLIANCNGDLNFQGFKDTMNIMQKIRIHLEEKVIIANKFELKFPVKSAVSEEIAFPYFFGGIETHWILPKIIRREIY